MKSKFLAWLLVAWALMLGVCQPAQAQTYDRITSAQLSAIMKEEGYSFSLDKDGDVVWKIDGFRVLVMIYPDKQSLQFKATFTDGDATPERINEWNRAKRYSKSYLNEEEHANLELDLDLVGGVQRERIKDFLKTCHMSFTAWLNTVVR